AADFSVIKPARNGKHMNRWAGLIVAMHLVLIVGCSQNTLIGDCRAELDQLPIVDISTINVEILVKDIVEKLGAEPYWFDIPEIDTACRAPVVLPSQFDQFTSAPPVGRVAKPVSRVRLDGLSGVVFVYMSQG